jgi:hypothetical protein
MCVESIAPSTFSCPLPPYLVGKGENLKEKIGGHEENEVVKSDEEYGLFRWFDWLSRYLYRFAE